MSVRMQKTFSQTKCNSAMILQQYVLHCKSVIHCHESLMTFPRNTSAENPTTKTPGLSFSTAPQHPDTLRQAIHSWLVAPWDWDAQNAEIHTPWIVRIVFLTPKKPHQKNATRSRRRNFLCIWEFPTSINNTVAQVTEHQAEYFRFNPNY